MPPDKRVLAADAFWRDEDSPDIEVQQMEALTALAKRLNFRMRSLQALPIERLARHLAQMTEVTDLIATRALIAYHFTTQRPLMSAFLDALGIAHDNGLITAEQVDPPSRDRLASAATTVNGSFDPADVALYLKTLAALDGQTWANMEGVLEG